MECYLHLLDLISQSLALGQWTAMLIMSSQTINMQRAVRNSLGISICNTCLV